MFKYSNKHLGVQVQVPLFEVVAELSTFKLRLMLLAQGHFQITFRENLAFQIFAEVERMQFEKVEQALFLVFRQVLHFRAPRFAFGIGRYDDFPLRKEWRVILPLEKMSQPVNTETDFKWSQSGEAFIFAPNTAIRSKEIRSCQALHASAYNPV
jgi:hypothetical protein